MEDIINKKDNFNGLRWEAYKNENGEIINMGV